MIYDKLSNVTHYKGISENLDIALTFLSDCDLNTLPLGKTAIKGNDVFINVMEANAGPLEERRFEIHKNYLEEYRHHQLYRISAKLY